MKRILLFSAIAAISLAAYPQTDTRTRVFDKSFKSVRASIEGNDYAPPVIRLGGQDRIKISFDELAPDMQYMRYSLIHCNADWQPSQLIATEFVSGFNEANVETYDFSSATFANFVHYEIAIPNDNMQILVSGNYLLKVYPEDDPDHVYFQTRFSVTENAVDISAELTSRTDIDYNGRHQQLAVAVDTRDYRVENMYNDLTVAVTQNSRHDNAVILTHPLRVSAGKAYYEHDRKLIFPAGNEFRRFEMTTVNYAGMGIEGYSFHEPFYHVRLYTDAPRTSSSYIYDRTQYGRFTIRQSDAYDSNTEADYMVVHFALKTPPLTDGQLYVDGEFTQHNFDSSNRMHYNPETGCYELAMLLKQGAYNYQYLWIPDGAETALTSTIEGDFHQTVNEYQIKVYNRKRGERYDRLIGYGIIYSGE